MCSYNKVNGSWACGGTPRLFEDHLRVKMGFKGFVLTDWWAHLEPSSGPNGLDMEQPGTKAVFTSSHLRALPNGRATIKRMAQHVLEGMLSSGAWDDRRYDCVPGTNCSFLLYQQQASSSQHRTIAREVAGSGAVLLKNVEGTLPIRRGARVALLGSACSAHFLPASSSSWDAGDYYMIGGSGGVKAMPRHQWTIERGLQDAKERGEISALTISRENSVDAALRAMRNHDVAVACGGSWSREGTDRRSLALDQHGFLSSLGQQRAAHASTQPRAYPPLVIVALAPGAITVDWAAHAQAALLVLLSGQITGAATADVLLGRRSPSGRLPLSLPLHERDVISPSSSSSVDYVEGLRVGWAGLIGTRVAYAFGHGLTYTTFEYSWVGVQPTIARPAAALRVVSEAAWRAVSGSARGSSNREGQECWNSCGKRAGACHSYCGAHGACCRQWHDVDAQASSVATGHACGSGSLGCTGHHCCVRAGDAPPPPPSLPPASTLPPALTLVVNVTNVGTVAAQEVAQLYLAFPAAYDEPPLLLRSFDKTALLPPGGWAIVEFELSDHDLAVWDVTADDWRRASGRFSASVRRSSRDQEGSLSHEFVVE